MPDLNAIAIDTSPSYTLGKERLSERIMLNTYN